MRAPVGDRNNQINGQQVAVLENKKNGSIDRVIQKHKDLALIVR